MDPNYRRDGPGKSPMGMDLVPVYADGADGEPAVALLGRVTGGDPPVVVRQSHRPGGRVRVRGERGAAQSIVAPRHVRAPPFGPRSTRSPRKTSLRPSGWCHAAPLRPVAAIAEREEHVPLSIEHHAPAEVPTTAGLRQGAEQHLGPVEKQVAAADLGAVDVQVLAVHRGQLAALADRLDLPHQVAQPLDHFARPPRLAANALAYGSKVCCLSVVNLPDQPAASVGIGCDGRQGLIDFVRDAGGQLAEDNQTVGVQQLFLELVQPLLVLAELGKVSNETDVTVAVPVPDFPDRKVHWEDRSVAAPAHFLAARANHCRHPGFAISHQIAVVLALMGLGHQPFDVVAQQFFLGVTEHRGGGAVESLDRAVIVDDDDGIHRRVHYCVQGARQGLLRGTVHGRPQCAAGTCPLRRRSMTCRRR